MVMSIILTSIIVIYIMQVLIIFISIKQLSIIVIYIIQALTIIVISIIQVLI